MLIMNPQRLETEEKGHFVVVFVGTDFECLSMIINVR